MYTVYPKVLIYVHVQWFMVFSLNTTHAFWFLNTLSTGTCIYPAEVQLVASLMCHVLMRCHALEVSGEKTGCFFPQCYHDGISSVNNRWKRNVECKVHWNFNLRDTKDIAFRIFVDWSWESLILLLQFNSHSENWKNNNCIFFMIDKLWKRSVFFLFEFEASWPRTQSQWGGG